MNTLEIQSVHFILPLSNGAVSHRNPASTKNIEDFDTLL